MSLSRFSAAFLMMAALAVTDVQAQAVRYRDRVFSASTSSTETFGTATNVMGAPQTLNMTIYSPSGDAMTNRPAVLVFFGGGFVSGTRSDANVVALCDSLVKRGYVAIAADYRTGVLAASTPEVERAIYRATQDVKAAIRYVRANHLTLGVDPARVYSAGFSAGAIGSIMAEFWDQSEVNTANVDASIMGTLNASGNNIVADGRPSGIISVAGGIPNLSWMDNGSKLLAMAHSPVDPVVPCSTAAMAVINEPISGSCVMLTPASIRGYQATLFPLPAGHLPSVGSSGWNFMVADLLNVRLYPNVVSTMSSAPVVNDIRSTYYDEDNGAQLMLGGGTMRISGSRLEYLNAVYFDGVAASKLVHDGDTVVYAQLPLNNNLSTISQITLSNRLISSYFSTSIPVPAFNNLAVWTGAVNSDWNTPGNWSINAAPDDSHFIVIEAGDNPLVLQTGTTVKSANLIAGYTADMTVNAGANLIAQVIVTNAAVKFHPQSRITSLNADLRLQSNSKARGGVTYYGNLWVKEDLNLHGDVYLRGMLWFEQPGGAGRPETTLSGLARTLYMESGAGYQGKIGARTGMLFGLDGINDVRFQLSMKVPGSTPAWYNLANPLLNQTLADFQRNVTVTGQFAGATPTHNSSVYFFNPTDPGLGGYVIPTAVTNAWGPTAGIRAWLWPSFFSTGGTLSYRGEYFSNLSWNGVNTPLSFQPGRGPTPTNGFNLLGNPLLTDLRFSATSGTDRANMYWVANKGVFAQWDGDLNVGTNGANGIIALGQGYFVKALNLGATHQILPAAQDTSITGPSIMRSQARQLVRLSLSATGYTSDEAVTVFAQGRNDNYVATEDGDKLTLPNSISLAFMAQGTAVGIQAQSEIGSQARILPLSISSPRLSVSLNMTELEQLAGAQVYLIDRLQQTRTLLSLGQPVNLTLGQQVENNRFELHVVPAMVTTLPGISAMQLELFPNPASETIGLSGLTEEASLMVQDVRGRTQLEVKVQPGQTLNVSELPAGTYMVRVQTASQNTVLKFVKR